MDDGTFRRSSLTGSLTDHARGERRLGAAKSLSFELLLLYDVNATEARNYENVYQKLSIIPNSSKLNTI